MTIMASVYSSSFRDSPSWSVIWPGNWGRARLVCAETPLALRLEHGTGAGPYGLPVGLPVGIPAKTLTHRSRLPVATDL